LLGNNHFDTSLFFRYTKSIKELGEALAHLFSTGIRREELVLTGKVGFIPFEYPLPSNPYKWIEEELINKGICKKSDILSDQYLLTPEFIDYTLEKSLKYLGVDGLDIFYIQNPQFLRGEVGQDRYLELMRGAFLKCEELCDRGLIGSYGVASWGGFFQSTEHMEYLSLQDLVDIAIEAGGDKNRFRYMQVPYNLGNVKAYTLKTQQLRGFDDLLTLFECAKELGLECVTTSSFLRMNIFKKPFSANFRGLCGGEAMSDVQRALQFVRSNPYTLTSVFSSSNPAHIEHNFEVVEFDRISEANYKKIFGL